MRRKNKYGTNKTLRFCQKQSQPGYGRYSGEELCIDRRGRWEIMDFLKQHAQSSDYSNKIVLRGCYTFYQYDGYNDALRRKPPKHLSFASRPDFIYQPYVNFITVNQNIFNLALHYGYKFLKDQKNLADLLDVNSPDIPVTLIYFLNGVEDFCSTDWGNAYKHAFGSHFAPFYTVCSGDYCPFGPKIRGIQTSNPRIASVAFIIEKYRKLERCFNCSCGSWEREANPDQHDYKKRRGELKIQRQEKCNLIKRVKAGHTV